MADITIALRPNRTTAEVYADAALVNGYKPTVVKDFTTDLLTATERDAFVYPTGTIPETKATNEFTQSDGTVLYKLSYSTETPNPITEQVFGKAVVAKSFGLQDAEVEGKATTMRAKTEYNV